MCNTAKQTPEQMMASALRFERALAILADPIYSFQKFNTSPTSFYVEKEQDGELIAIYMVSLETRTCSCPDYKRNLQDCKHILACDELLRQEQQIADHYDPNEYAL